MLWWINSEKKENTGKKIKKELLESLEGHNFKRKKKIEHRERDAGDHSTRELWMCRHSQKLNWS